jgi:hypothetical protein
MPFSFVLYQYSNGKVGVTDQPETRTHLYFTFAPLFVRNGRNIADEFEISTRIEFLEKTAYGKN